MVTSWTQPTAERHSKRWLLAGAVVIVVIIFVMLYRFFPPGLDYINYYRPIAEQWLAGDHTMYDGPNFRLFYPPWTLFVILPTGYFSVQAGSALLNTVGLVCLMLAIYIHHRIKPISLIVVPLSLLNLHLAYHVFYVQLDLFALLGVMLGWWAIIQRRPLILGLGLCLIAMKFVNLLLVLGLFALAIRKWSIREMIQACAPPLIMILVSSAMLGFDWPLKYVANFEEPQTGLSITIWRATTALGLPNWLPVIALVIAMIAFLRLAWREGLSERSLCIAIATNLAFATYAHSDYYVLLTPAIIIVAGRSWKWGLLAYASTFTVLVRSMVDMNLIWVAVSYPLLLLVALWILRPVQPKVTSRQV